MSRTEVDLERTWLVGSTRKGSRLILGACGGLFLGWAEGFSLSRWMLGRRFGRIMVGWTGYMMVGFAKR